MRRRIIAVLLSLSVGVAAMPMPVMAEELVSEGAVEVAAEAPEAMQEAEAAAAEETASEEAVEALEAEAEAPVEAADEVLIIDEEAPVVAEAEAPAVAEEAPAEDEAVIEEAEAGEETDQGLGAYADADGLSLTVGGQPIAGLGNLDKDDVEIKRADSGVTVDFDPFSGGSSAPTVKLTYQDPSVLGAKTVDLLENRDYTVTPGNAAITIVFDKTGEYRNLGNCTVEYTVIPFNLENPGSDCKVEVTYDDDIYIYNGEKQYPKNLKVVITATGKKSVELTRGKDYTVEPADAASDLESAGTQKVKIHGKGNYTGDYEPAKPIEYKIEPAEVKTDIRNNITLPENLVYPVDYLGFNESGLKLQIYLKITGGVFDTLRNGPVYPENATFEILNENTGSYVALTRDNVNLNPGVHKYRVYIHDYPNYKSDYIYGSYKIESYSTLETIFNSDVSGIKDTLAELEYNGLNQSSDVKRIIKDGFDYFIERYRYDRDIEVVVPDEMKKAGSYTVTIKGAADGDKWTEDETFETVVTIKPRQMAKQGEYDIGQIDDTRFNPAEAKRQRHFDGSKDIYDKTVVTITDIGLATGKNTNLIEGEDFIVVREEEVKEAGVTKRYIYIIGNGNYRSTQEIGKNPDAPVEIGLEVTPETKVDLGSEKLIRAEVKASVDLEYHNGDSIELKPEDIKVEELIDGNWVEVNPKNYYISRYDTGLKVPGSAGKHTVTIQATTGNDYYKNTRVIPYTIIGDRFDSVYEFKDKNLPDQEVLAQVIVPKPDIVHIGSSRGLDPRNYDYGYYKADAEVKPENRIIPRRVTGGDLISFPEIGRYKLVVTPTDGLRQSEGVDGELVAYFNVVGRDLEKYCGNKTITLSCTNLYAGLNKIVWPGRTVVPGDFKIEVKDLGLPVVNVLAEKKDYTVEFNGADKAGKASVTIKAVEGSNYVGSYTFKDQITIEKRPFTYNADGFAARAIVRDQPYSGGNRILIDSEDVTVELYNADTKEVRPVPAEEYDVECTPVTPSAGFEVYELVRVKINAAKEGSNYTGSFSTDADGNTPIVVGVVPANIGDNTIFAVEGIDDKVYNGSEQTQDETKIELVDIRTGNKVDRKCWKVDHYENNKDIGTAAVILKAVDGTGYTGEARAEFRIAERGLKAELEVTPTSETSLVYDGTAKTKESGAFTVKVWDDKTGEVVDEDAYVLSYSDDPVNVGEVKVIATAKPDSTYAGKAEGSFMITQAENELTASVEKVEVGKTTKVAATAKGSGKISYSSSNEAVATVSGDGTVTGVSAGVAQITVTVAADRNYKTKSTVVTVTVTQKVNNTVTASDVKKVFKNKKQSFTISASALGNAPISFKSDNKNITVNATTGKVTVKAGYVGTAKITITAAATEDYLKATKTVKVTIVPKATTLKSVTSKNGKITAKWAKKNIATCYQLQYATDKNFTKNKGKVWSKSETATSKTIKKTFTKGKTYYVRIRTCTRTDKSELLYSAWSAAKKVTIK